MGLHFCIFLINASIIYTAMISFYHNSNTIRLKCKIDRIGNFRCKPFHTIVSSPFLPSREKSKLFPQESKTSNDSRHRDSSGSLATTQRPPTVNIHLLKMPRYPKVLTPKTISKGADATRSHVRLTKAECNEWYSCLL